MIDGWTLKTKNITVGQLANEHLVELEAEPVFAEIGEKVRKLTAELHEKIISQELQWSLMMTPLTMVEDLKRMCEGEIERRTLETKEMTKEQ